MPPRVWLAQDDHFVTGFPVILAAWFTTHVPDLRMARIRRDLGRPSEHRDMRTRADLAAAPASVTAWLRRPAD
ncbi:MULTISPECIES: hypothetical protein [unclassified Streptomyces]|uniref:hypothetical protein n=1 Tax=unclassified Streptomyces TaxID=2593676 RepID=UPI00342F1E33